MVLRCEPLVDVGPVLCWGEGGVAVGVRVGSGEREMRGGRYLQGLAGGRRKGRRPRRGTMIAGSLGSFGGGGGWGANAMLQCLGSSPKPV